MKACFVPLSLCVSSVFISSCGSTTTFNPRSAYPPDPWVKGYSNPDDCIGGEKLAAIEFDLPSYPKSAFRNGQQGWAIIRLNVDAAGLTQNVKVERSVPSGVFETASRKAVEAWRFQPPAKPLSDCRVLLRYRAGEASLGG
ncbi:energy transducer TonB [Litorimonas cladophorae]|uniref:energy transducer TonB n=1 Tax=Litorimonas cladophorae TaxID=1220491 RepID=UPI001672047C|nr:energy transducer TonB [Litorimonas cladophorae]